MASVDIPGDKSDSLSMQEILHLTVDQLKSELASRGFDQCHGLTKPDLQVELCKILSIGSIPQGLLTLETLDKKS
jgi:hypothetical protein